MRIESSDKKPILNMDNSVIRFSRDRISKEKPVSTYCLRVIFFMRKLFGVIFYLDQIDIIMYATAQRNQPGLDISLAWICFIRPFMRVDDAKWISLNFDLNFVPLCSSR